MSQAPTEVGRDRRGLVRSAALAATPVLVGALVVAGLGWSAPAEAHGDRDDHGMITLSDTGDVGSPPTVTGRFSGASAFNIPTENIRAVSLTVSPRGPTGGSAASADGCDMATAGQCGTTTVSFEWELPALAYNGPYVVNATADHCLFVCLSSTTANFTPREFRMAADPAAPADLKVDTGTERHVVLSWERNPEPDILFYQVSRKDGSGSFRRVGGDVRQPPTGRVAITDSSTSATGGDFAYRVVAVRKGASGDDQTTTTSRASAERSVTVAPPPSTVPPGAPGAELKPAGADTNISSYLSGRSPTLPSPKTRFLDLPDTGFEGSLPFGELPEDMSEPGEEEAYPATLETRRLEAFNRGRPLIPIAAGAILLLLAAHLRLLNKRSKPGAPARSSAAEFIATLDASKRSATRVDVGTAETSGGHDRVRPGAALADLPVWGEVRGVTLLPAAPGADAVGDATSEPPQEVWANHDADHADLAADLEPEEPETDEQNGPMAELNGQPASVVTFEEELEDYEEEPVDVLELEDELEDYEEEPVDVLELEDELEDDEEEPVDVPELEDELEDDAAQPVDVLELEDELEDDAAQPVDVLELEEELEDDAAQPVDVLELEDELDEPPIDVVELIHAGTPGEGEDTIDLVEFEDEPADEVEIVAELVPRVGPVVMPKVEPVVGKQNGDRARAGRRAWYTTGSAPAPPPESEAESPAEHTSEPVTNLDDFEWSEEPEFVEPEIEVFVRPRAGRRLARR